MIGNVKFSEFSARIILLAFWQKISIMRIEDIFTYLYLTIRSNFGNFCPWLYLNLHQNLLRNIFSMCEKQRLYLEILVDIDSQIFFTP